MGTSVGTSIFNAHGWRAAAAVSLGWQSFCVLVLLARGPHCSRYTWIGWEGGAGWRKTPKPAADAQKPAVEDAPSQSEKTVEAKGRTASVEGPQVEKAESRPSRESIQKPRAEADVEQA